jgi:hypothetical protein
MESYTEAGWKQIIESLKVKEKLDSNGLYYLDANQIKDISNREPRLMTKFDTRESRPASLKNITILAVENGKYALLSSVGYHDVEPPKYIETHYSDQPYKKGSNDG